MAKIVELNMENEEELCEVAKALSSPARIEILKLLYHEGLIINEIAKKLNIPASSAALHVKVLEKANLIRLEEQPGTRGSMKLCNRKRDIVNISLIARNNNINETASVEMPIGAFSECKVIPTCGLADEEGIIGMEDTEYCFYLPERIHAQIIWSSGGYLEYRFPNLVPKGRSPKKLILSMEICSEAPSYREDWKSDITIWINGMECGTFTSPGDFGARRGRLNPITWESGNTQHGLLMTWEINQEGSYINEKKAEDRTINEFEIMSKSSVTVRIGNKPDAKYMGGFNLFGKKYGDYAQDIIMNVEYC
ncbi:ArsR/SmtB family transcription factor [Anaerocolumna sp. MB42-C2]|uniref:ArsR/SmtB family transcription factor n=1 Tax=Anaerocolumna sp. MB42-C2 TaxID=3070997 RepID=UPI0027DEB8F7|nr:helix-turn-helix domain-containing protein [Anaerocolumna sp. MB42-C2]WMJ85986.1 helix-turn-helix domain-containing protein [Anaerocolumna sp. MB42-C2]